MTKPKWRRAVLILIPCLALVQACGDDSSSTAPTAMPAPPTPTPTPEPVSRVIAEGSGSGLRERFLAAIPFVTTATGTIEATVDWTFVESDLDIFLVQGSCTLDQFNTGTCPFAAFSTSTTAKPEQIVLPNAAAASYTLYIGNFGGKTEAFSFQVVLTSTAFASGRPASADGDVRVKGALRGIQDLH